jgi:6-phosphogluconolactonase
MPRDPELPITIHDDADAVARHAARVFVETIDRARSEHRRASVALAGGSTPRRLYELIAREHAFDVDWRHVEIFFGDERSVPPNHADSNYHMAAVAWLDHVPISSLEIHRMEAEDADLVAAALRYETTLCSRLPPDESGFPTLDLIWLGMGDDGHTASIFPGTSALTERARAVVMNEVPQLGTRRLTLTLPVLCAARRVQFLVTGASKARRIAEVARLAATPLDLLPPDALPSARVRPRRGHLEWLIDRAAATELR